ncbi:S-phase kinase-associated protein 2 [Elysia marginata]|uniref:S-phase kinase-associated protein 2 n=1 Tax=Elysia marginata TaxID=1093978 RepID=A0AAV4H1B7_9GAST|nr:S-phase kinase-associated protein 2 [Elysia marginata]
MRKDEVISEYKESEISGDKLDLVTPAALSTASESPPVPAAPRILLVNQQANALPEGLNRLAPSAIFQQILRTPPSAKTSKVFLKRKSADVYRGFDPFDRVSDEIILRIFHQLPRHTMCTCALVCRRWARIVCDLSLWRRMDFGGRPLKVGILKILLERGVEVLRLNKSEIMGDFTSTVDGAPDPKRSPLSEDRMYRLQMLDMSMCNVKTSMVEAILKFCPYLRKISLENIPVTEQLLTNVGFTSPYLDTVNLAMCQGVTFKGLKCIIEHCPSLSHLNIAWTGMSHRDIQEVIKILPEQLLSLDMSGSRNKISDEDIETLCHQCPRLRDLDISDSTELTGASIDSICENLTCLRRISLSRCYSISPQALVNLTNIRSLATINVFGMMRDSSLMALEGYLKRFKVNREPFSTVARPTPSNEKVVKIWNVIPKDGPVV